MRLHLYLVLAFSVCCSGCAVLTPLVQDFNIVPVEQERQIGEKMESQISSQMQLVTGTEMNARVQRIGEKLVRALPRQNFNYEFHVIRNDSPNAFAIPGGSIYVHTGLLDFVQSDSELAGVLGHEIGHVYERHPAKSISRAYGLNYLAGLVLPENTGQFSQLAAQFAAGGVLNKYGRDDEREADEIGYYLMRKAGYDPQGLLHFLQRLQQATGGSRVPAFLSSHPPAPERIERLRRLANTGMDTLRQEAARPDSFFF